MVVASEPSPPRLSPATTEYAARVAAWYVATLDLLENALRRDERSLRDRIAAVIVGAERMVRVRRAKLTPIVNPTTWTDIEERWRRARCRCSFPTEPQITVALDVMGEPPPPFGPHEAMS